MPVIPSPEVVVVEKAKFTPLAGRYEGRSIEVHFNPASLQYTVANTQGQNKNSQGVQFVSQSTAKLTMDLVFDTTLTGVDVRGITDKTAQLLRPYQNEGGKVPPQVEFRWGVYTFKGIVDQYKETLDFFSAGGVPLRSSVNLTLSKIAKVFASSTKNPNASVDDEVVPEPVVVSDRPSPAPGGASPSSVANAMGDPRAARAIASLSAPESLRFGGGSAALVVAGSVSLSPSAAFAAGTGLRITATAGAAFAGLRAGASATASRGVTNTQALLPSPRVASGGGFALGGAANAGAGGSLSADVGASADLSARIGFPD
jgi:hypothetical protein